MQSAPVLERSSIGVSGLIPTRGFQARTERQASLSTPKEVIQCPVSSQSYLPLQSRALC